MDASSSRTERPLKVREIFPETPGVLTIRLDNSDRLVPVHKPGQHAKIGVEAESGTAWKSFSISSPPTRPDSIDLTVKLKPAGVVSRLVHALKPGDSVLFQGPSGNFFFDQDVHLEPLVMVVAGIGITPVMSILRTLRDRSHDRPVTLLYGCRSSADVIFARELDEIRCLMADFRPFVSLSRPVETWDGERGRIEAELLSRALGNPAGGRYFVSGPGTFNAAIGGWLADRGVPSDRVHVEVFGKAAGRGAQPSG